MKAYTSKQLLLIFLCCCVLLVDNGCAKYPYRIGLPDRSSLGRKYKRGASKDYNGLGVAREEAGKFEGAIRAYRKCLGRSPDNNLARTNLGNVLAKVGRFDEAEHEYRLVLRTDPENLAALNNLAWLLISVGDDGQIEEGQAIVAEEIWPRAEDPVIKAYVLDTWAWAYYRQGKYGEALERIELARQLLGQDEFDGMPLFWGHRRMILLSSKWRAVETTETSSPE